MGTKEKLNEQIEAFIKFSKKFKNFGIWAEAFGFYLFNRWYLNHYNIDFTNFLEILKDPSHITNIIAILTASVVAIGFLYYIGYVQALRQKGIYDRHSLQYSITYNGSILFLGIFLSLLYVLLESKYPEIFRLILINIAGVIGVAIFNEIIMSHRNPQPKVTLTTINADEPSKDLEFFEITSDNKIYKFKDKNGTTVHIPVEQIKELIIHDAKNDKE